MIRLEIVAKTQWAAEELAELLGSDQPLDVVRAGALGAAFRPDPNADVVIALHVVPPAMPEGGPKVVLVTHHPRIRRTAGVRAWLRADASPVEIVGAASAAYAGLYVLHAEQLPVASPVDDGFTEQLTPRELMVLRMMADGSSNKEIALELGISSNTAKFHVAQVLAKLHVGSRTEAVRIGIQRGLVLL